MCVYELHELLCMHMYMAHTSNYMYERVPVVADTTPAAPEATVCIWIVTYVYIYY